MSGKRRLRPGSVSLLAMMVLNAVVSIAVLNVIYSLFGLHAALAAWHCWQSDTGGLVSVSLRDVAAHCANFDRPAGADAMQQRRLQWQELLDVNNITTAIPTARMPAGAGAHRDDEDRRVRQRAQIHQIVEKSDD